MDFATETGDAQGTATLMLHLLGRCNLECLHCYMEGSPWRREQLPVEFVLPAIAECEQLGIGTLYLTGGEPLLYRGLDDVLNAVAQAPKLQVTLCTNGTLITHRHATFFRELGLRVSISIDGDPVYHDHFRKLRGAFRSSERGLRTLVEAGVAVTIVSTLSQANIQSLPFLIEWASTSGAVRLLVQPLLKLGRGVEIADQCLDTVQMNRILLQLSDLANKYRTHGLDCKVIGASRRFLLAHPCGAYVCNGTGCHRRVAKEIKKLVVREDGTVLPEVPNLNHRFALGNIRDGSLSTLVSRYFTDGYSKFDQLCRTAYAEVLPTWELVVVPWEQIVAQRSHHWAAQPECQISSPACQACS